MKKETSPNHCRSRVSENQETIVLVHNNYINYRVEDDNNNHTNNQ